MATRTKRSKQRFYKMKGCSKKTRRNKKYLGGSTDVNLAYPSSNVQTVPNSNLAYSPNGTDISKAYPSTGPSASGFNFLNSNSQNGGCGCGMQSGGRHRSGCTCSECMSKHGGRHRSGCTCSECMSKHGGRHRSGCTCSECMSKHGGRCMRGCTCSRCAGQMRGGATGVLSYGCSSSGGCTDNMMGGSAHRVGCKCSICRGMTGGGNGGLPYPDGLLGNAWTPSVSGWPGVDGVSMNRNHLGYNTYAPYDVSRQMVDVGAAAPFLNGVVDAPAAKPYLGGGKRRKSGKSRKNKRGGGSMTNLLGQDFLNVGRQLQYGLGSSYNAIRGFSSPVNPLPWKDQMTHK
jgi:hypothetical protein